jgi:protein phosphatase 2C family protein 2/3
MGERKFILVYAHTHTHRDYMEDATIVHTDLTSHTQEQQSRAKWHFTGVFDGHGGAAAAEYCCAEIPGKIIEKCINDPTNTLRTIQEACQEVEAELLEKAGASQDGSGAVGCMVLVSGRQYWVAHMGDCRAVLSCGGSAQDLTQDHNPKVESERRRIEAAGATISCDGYVEGLIAVSRSWGDWDIATGMKIKGVGDKVECKKFYVTNDDEFILIACDGVWDVLSSDAAVKFVRSSLKKHNDVQKACDDLVSEALRQGSMDNISAAIVGFGHTAATGDVYVIPSREHKMADNQQAVRARRHSVVNGRSGRQKLKIGRSAIDGLQLALDDADEDTKDTLYRSQQSSPARSPMLFPVSPPDLSPSSSSEVRLARVFIFVCFVCVYVYMCVCIYTYASLYDHATPLSMYTLIRRAIGVARRPRNFPCLPKREICPPRWACPQVCEWL